ncbi:MAG TPA: hypothetical protein PKE38_14935 [Ignavibacteriaceae bacterium]|nr:hypothetical protein [Ignavibacteriaceae bacterium]
MTPTNNHLQMLFDEFVKSDIIPQHKCKQHLRIIEETHSVNSLYNIVIARKCKCKICGKVFEYYDPNGLD